MKKRLLTLLLSIMLVVSMMPVTAFAVTDTWDVDLVVSKNSKVKYNEQDTIEIGFGVQSDNLKLRKAQSIVIAFDKTVFDFVSKTGKSAVAEAKFLDNQMTEAEGKYIYSVHSFYSNAEEDNVAWDCKPYCGKSTDGKTGFIMLQPAQDKDDCTVNPQAILASILLGFKPGKDEKDITSSSIRLATAAETTKLAQSLIIILTDGNNTQEVKADGSSTLTGTVQVKWNGITPTKPAYSGTIAAPTVASNKGGKVELNTVIPSAGGTVKYGYSKTNDGKNITWQDGTTFSSLTVGDTLYFYAKVVETSSYAEKVSDASAAVTVLEKELTNLEITTEPTTKTYTHGDTFKTDGMKVEATYNDGSTDTNFTGYTVAYETSGESYLCKGNTKVTLNAGGKNVEVTGLTVNAKALTVTGLTAVNREYKAGYTLVELTGGTLSGVVGSEDVSLLSTPTTGRILNAGVGDNKDVSIDPLSLTGFDSGNYTLTQPTGIKVNIMYKNISGATIALGTQATYNGSEQSVAISKVTVDGTDLNGTDYTVKSGDKATNVGDNTLVIEGKGNYNGEASATWSLVAKNIGDASVSITLSPASYDYTGSTITPDPVVKDGATTLVKGTDYTVSYSKNTYVGTATLTINGKGNYTGTKDANFTITAADQNPTFTTPVDLAKGGAMLDLTTLVSGAKGDNMTFTIPPATTSASLSGHTLTSTGIKGEVKVSVSIAAKDVDGDGNNEYNTFSKSEAITVNVVDKTSDTTTMKVSQGDITYGGSVSPDVTNQPEGTGTVSYTYEGRDGTTYSSATAPTNAGKYTVTARCENTTTIYTATDDFKILQKSISGMTVTLDNTSLEYNGSAQTVNVTSVGSLTATDYTVTSGNSGTDVSNYTVTVTGKGNYKDTAQATWQITPATLTVTPNASQSKMFNEVDPALTYTYSGNASGQTPDFTGALNRAAGEDVGDYAIQIGTLALKDNGTFKAANYTLGFAETTVNFKIQKATFTGTAAKTVDILKNQTTAQSGTLTAADFFTGTIPADAKITGLVAPASAAMMESVSVDTATDKLNYTSKTSIAAASNEDYTVTITTKNYNDIHATLTFQPTDKDDADVSITGVPTASVTYGDSFTLKAEAANVGTGTGTWTWSSSNSSVLAVTDNGATATVKVLTAGNATITAKYESDTTVDTETTAAITAVTREISVKADDKSMTVNAALPTFTVTYGNFASGDTADTVFETKAVASTTTDGKTTGTFDITITTAPTLKTEMANKYAVGTSTNGTLKVNAKYSGGSHVSKVQKPEITIIGSGKADLSADGRTATITADAGHELVSVVLNGKEMGKVEKLTGLKTGDKATITFQAKTDGKAEMDKMIAQKASKLTLMARSKKTAKLNIKIVVKGDLKAITDAGYTVKYKFYRSTKKSAGYKAVLTKKAPSYVNTYGKKGTMYYYKARVMIYDKNGNFVAQTALKQCKYANRLWTK